MGLQGVDRTCDVLEALGDEGRATLGRVAGATGLGKSAAHRVLRSLAERGYARQEPDGSYRLGYRVAQLAAAALGELDLGAAARPQIERLAAVCGETVHLMVLDGDEVLYADKVESTQIVRMSSRIGMRQSAHTTACGKAILAAMPEPDVRRLARRTGLPARTPATITGIDHLLAACAATRKSGYAIDDRENEPDVRCVAMAILDAGGAPLGAVSISAPAYRLARRRITELVPELRVTVTAIEAAVAPRGPRRRTGAGAGATRPENAGAGGRRLSGASGNAGAGGRRPSGGREGSTP